MTLPQLPCLGSCQDSLGKPSMSAAYTVAAGLAASHAAAELAGSFCMHRVSQFRARVSWPMGTTDGKSQSCLMPATCRQEGSWWPWVAQGEHCLAGDTLPRPSCSQLGTGFMILIGKSAGKGGGDGGIDKGVAPLPQHSTLLPAHRTFIEDRTGAWMAGDCPESAGAWGAGQAEVVVLGGPGAVEVRPAAVLGPLFQIPLAARDWAPPGTPCQPWRSSPSSAAASINTKVRKSLS